MRPLLSILGVWCMCAGAFAADATPAPAPAPAPEPAPPTPAPEPAPEPSATPAAKPHARVMLGITAKDRDESPSQVLALFPPAIVGSVAPGTNAQRLGIKVGDTITSLNGHPVANMGDLVQALSLVSPGDAATVVVSRAGASLTLTGVFAASEPPEDKDEKHDDAVMP